MNKKNEYQDEGLKGNERIEDAIFALQKEATQEQLAHTLTVIRRRMKDSGQVIVADERGRTTDRCCGTGSGTGTNEVTDSENSGR